jgi:hypothetical protein
LNLHTIVLQNNTSFQISTFLFFIAKIAIVVHVYSEIGQVCILMGYDMYLGVIMHSKHEYDIYLRSKHEYDFI